MVASMRWILEASKQIISLNETCHGTPDTQEDLGTLRRFVPISLHLSASASALSSGALLIKFAPARAD